MVEGRSKQEPEPSRAGSLMAILIVSTAVFVLGVAYLQTGPGVRLYLVGEQLLLSSQSGTPQEFKNLKAWESPPLWGAHDAQQEPSIVTFKADGKESQGQSISTSLLFDFDGDGETDRREVYEGVTLDLKKGYQKFSPPLLHGKGEFREFQGGRVTVVLESRDGKDEPIILAGKPGHVNVPYSSLRNQQAP